MRNDIKSAFAFLYDALYNKEGERMSDILLKPMMSNVDEECGSATKN